MSSKFTKILGQDQAVALLDSAISNNRIARVYLFVGPEGVGRRLTAEILANILLSQDRPLEEHPFIEQQVLEKNNRDLLWIEPTYSHQGELYTRKKALEAGLKLRALPQIRIEQVKQITEFFARIPEKANRFVIVLEDVDTMNESAVNALLKTLEEPKKATLILIAQSKEKLLPTLVSRCQIIPFYSIPLPIIQKILVSHSEILEHPDIMLMAEGSPGKAIGFAQQLKTIPVELLERIKTCRLTPFDALEIAREIEENLELENQLFLIDYLQYYYWYYLRNQQRVSYLEKTREYLLSYVQPRLVWECTLLDLCQVAGSRK